MQIKQPKSIKPKTKESKLKKNYVNWQGAYITKGVKEWMSV